MKVLISYFRPNKMNFPFLTFKQEVILIAGIFGCLPCARVVLLPYFRSALESFTQGHTRVSSWVRLSGANSHNVKFVHLLLNAWTRDLYIFQPQKRASTFWTRGPERKETRFQRTSAWEPIAQGYLTVLGRRGEEETPCASSFPSPGEDPLLAQGAQSSCSEATREGLCCKRSRWLGPLPWTLGPAKWWVKMGNSVSGVGNTNLGLC